MLKIRLQRIGRKNDPSFRVVVTDSRRGPKSGNNIEVVGSHNPSQGAPVIKEDRVKYWLSKGAKVSDTIHNLLVKKGIINAKTIDVLPKQKPASVENSGESQPVVEESVAESAPAAETPAESTQEAPEEAPATTEEAPAPAEEPKEEEKPTE